MLIAPRGLGPAGETHMPKRTKRSAPRKRTAPKRAVPRKRVPKLSPVPEGMRTVTPYLAIDGAARALDFYKHAFGAKELAREPAPDGRLVHAMMKIGDSVVMMSDEFPGSLTRAPTNVGGTTVMLHIYSKDVDRLWARALAAGAKVSMPLEDRFWGERYGQLEDPFGHHWTLSMRIPMTASEREAKRQAAMAVFAAGEHPGVEPSSS